MGKRIMVMLAGMALSASLTNAQAGAEIVFGYSMDGRPVSYPRIVQGKNAGTDGFCAALREHLQAEGYQIREVEQWFDTRFTPFAQSLAGKPGLECGPHSRTLARVAALQATDGAFKGEFSQTFAVTATKLLVRSERLAALYTQPATLRIGVLKSAQAGSPVTSTVIEGVFANAQIVALASRKEAVERLLQPLEATDALDAYASDEILLDSMLNNPDEIPAGQREHYSIEPPLYGFSREEYAVVVYNDPQLTQTVNAWLESAAGTAATAALQPASDGFVRSLQWLARGDHLFMARSLLSLLAVGVALLLTLRLWGRVRRQLRAKAAAGAEALPAPEPVAVQAAEQVGEPADIPLTAHQLQIAKLWASGQQAGMIAKQLEIGSHRTVEAHIRTIYQKTQTGNRIELFRHLQQHGLL